MIETHLSTLVLLMVLLLLSAFFSASETGMMSLNRYRLKHRSKTDPHAKRIHKLIERPDRLLGVILIGNNVVNIYAAALATNLATEIWGAQVALSVAPLVLTVIILIFAEITPKTLAAVKPDRIAYPASLPLTVLLFFMYPLVWFVNMISNGILRIFGVQTNKRKSDALNRDELKTAVREAKGLIPGQYQRMLISVLDLEKVTVNDIMIPRNEVVGIDLDGDARAITAQLMHTQHTLLPVYQGDLNKVRGILHMRDAGNLLAKKDPFTASSMKRVMEEPFFVPEGTPLHMQLTEFQKHKRKLGLVVDEYGEVLGLVTLADILEEIVGEFTTDDGSSERDIQPQRDGSYIIDGSINLRDLNRQMDWEFPTTSAKTLNGMIIEHLETIPNEGVCILINQHPIEVLEIKDNTVSQARISQQLDNPSPFSG